MKKEKTDKLLLKRYDFKPSFKGWDVKGVLNPAAIRLPNKKIALFVRIAESKDGKEKGLKSCPVISSEADYKKHYGRISRGEAFKMGGNVVKVKDGVCKLSTISHFRKVIISEDGFKVEKIFQRPAYTGRKDSSAYGVEDPRIVKIGNKYIMTYVSIADREGVCTSLATSKDLIKWERHGIIFREQNKDAFLFPEKIGGEYVALNRPEGFFEFSKPSIWISHSKDLIYWGKEKSIMQPRENSWEENRLGGGAPPIKTKKGWLIIYHGVRNIKDNGVYSAGAALLDLKDPSKIIARSPKNNPLFKPTKKYEKEGFISNVVFPTGAVPTLDGKHLLIYSGGGDKVVSVRKISFKDIFKNMKNENPHSKR